MKRIFISFAIEDENLRDFLRGQSRNTNSPFEFVDMSVKQPWDSQWKTKCRTRIRGCDGMISIITRNTKKADGQIWEMNCAIDEGIPLLAIYGNKDHIGATIPNECGYLPVVDWNWEKISAWIKQL
ncbi:MULTISPECIES: TIR domain-containing protein [Streptococcus]|jgi:hypothetical protein|uniref:Thoeris protein ThsB TIR-like domain-containing protein n=3 Tax=Streptococcus TaxID=1301 RepID=V8BAH0_STRPA|nr:MULTISPECIES: hypothetical protein [Streptococcus]ETD11815.1 hypothetical protein HMPREF1195_01404 [Streptococcus parasanguinis CC87K]MBT3138557.1 hypothetical protein [Streptococcus parasanguinis]MBZ2079785.1 hypothetical protein [Streptococcus parasanguinis]MDB8622306.1 hypothetical protein [Streptococcus parasanguinis]MTR41952.1 hypothetical protein [Streptococcus parasanguinis]